MTQRAAPALGRSDGLVTGFSPEGGHGLGQVGCRLFSRQAQSWWPEQV